MVSPAAEPAPQPAQAPDPVQQLLALYPHRALALHLSTQKLEQDLDRQEPLLRGRLIPPALLPILGKDIQSEGNDVFALAQLTLLNQYTGLLTRVPGVYVSSRILLFVLNPAADSITDQCEVAETFGDAGDSYVRTSVLSWDTQRQLRIKVSQGNCWPLDENLDKITCVDSTLVYQLRGGKFAVISRTPEASK